MYNRNQPYLARIKERYSLTTSTSSKKVFHLVLDTTIPYQVGDSVAILPQNDPQEVEEIVEKVQGSPVLREFLTHKANISRISSSLLKTKDPHVHIEKSYTLLDILKLTDLSFSEADLMHFLLPLMPRFYSIANSPKVFPNEIHLTVGYVEYEAHGTLRKGIGSHFLCNLAIPNETDVPLYIQPSHGFRLPNDPETSLIFVGPGTGIAPFRAFMQERIATLSTARNWLFFGERNRASDFLYEAYWTELERQERLRLSLAFSRDQDQKIYVQHRMYEERKSLWDWIENGAYFYVCGDAEKMAKDVEAMLKTIACEEGKMTLEEARAWLKKLRLDKRYLTDVY